MFAPNAKVLQETIEKINELTTQEVLVAGLDSFLNDKIYKQTRGSRGPGEPILYHRQVEPLW